MRGGSSGLLGLVLQRREPHQLAAFANRLPGPAAQLAGHAHGLGTRQTGPAMAMEAFDVYDFNIFRWVDGPAALSTLFVRRSHSPGEGRRLAPAAGTGGRGSGKGRARDRICYSAHLGEAHRAGKGQAGVAQALARALLEQSSDGRRELRSATLGPAA